MTARALISGRVFFNPESRTGKTGKPFATMKVRDGSGNEVQWWNVVAFGDMVEEMMRLREGDEVSAVGVLRCKLFTDRHGEVRIDRSILVDRLISLAIPF